MRRYIKNQIKDILGEIRQMHILLKQSFMDKNDKELPGQLAECQELAIVVGKAIEDSEGESENSAGCYAVNKLEKYCEFLYETSVEVTQILSTGRTIKRAEAEHRKRQLDSYIDEVEDIIENDISEHLEVVFLPYKVSMWDSLESIWLAAREDTSCISYVVPIPYFDKSPDGKLEKMHYEGADFPDDVPITDWQEYDIAKRQPDMIYIHNPYDGTNKVTTVHPAFYAKELKNYTQMLVYIPYFVCANDDVPTHFCVTPGTIHADKVIVQSEKVRQIYIREYHKFEEKYKCRNRFGCAEEKFVALGSPKYDKVCSTTRENIVLPQEWERKIVQQDGRRKKVLLYNTSVTKLMEGGDKTIDKIKSVFTLLKDREDVVLLWRPHPLSTATYSAARPDLLEKYEAIIEEYKKEDWGIYDDTPELHRAIAVSDAYYGDMSSLVELYRITGKPIMIQDVSIMG